MIAVKGRIQSQLQKIEKNGFNGFVIQAFTFAIQDELYDYYRLIAILEQETQRMAVDQGLEETKTAKTAIKTMPFVNVIVIVFIFVNTTSNIWFNINVS